MSLAPFAELCSLRLAAKCGYMLNQNRMASDRKTSIATCRVISFWFWYELNEHQRGQTNKQEEGHEKLLVGCNEKRQRCESFVWIDNRQVKIFDKVEWNRAHTDCQVSHWALLYYTRMYMLCISWMFPVVVRIAIFYFSLFFFSHSDYGGKLPRSCVVIRFIVHIQTKCDFLISNNSVFGEANRDQSLYNETFLHNT